MSVYLYLYLQCLQCVQCLVITNFYIYIYVLSISTYSIYGDLYKNFF